MSGDEGKYSQEVIRYVREIRQKMNDIIKAQSILS